MVIGGETLDLGKVTIPVYNLAAREDHIAPARSVFNGAKLFGGDDALRARRLRPYRRRHQSARPKPKYQYWTGERAVGNL